MPRPKLIVALAFLVACSRNPASTTTTTSGGGGSGGTGTGAGGTAAGPLSRDVPGGSASQAQYEINPGRQLDLVFLIDNSDSMAEEQDKLAKAFAQMIKPLESLPGGLPDLRIAFVSSNFGAGPNVVSPACPVYGDRGRFLVKTDCGLDANAYHWLEYNPNAGTKNFAGGDLATVVGCMAHLGTGGCGYEHQLQSLRASLYDVNPDNRGFLRPDAYLGIVIVTDEDDCSAEPYATFFDEPVPSGQATSLICSTLGHVCKGQEVPAMDFSAPLDTCKPYERQQDPAKDSHPETDPVRKQRLINVSEMVDYIKAKKPGRPDRILVSAIMGWADNGVYRVGSVSKPNPKPRVELDNVPICESVTGGNATAAVRLKAFVDAFGDNGAWYSICQDDFGPPLKDIGDRLAHALSKTCAPQSLLDKDPAQPDLQPECVAADRIPQSNGTYVDTVVPACTAGGPRPCWRAEADPSCASKMRIVRESGDQPARLGALFSVSCRDDAAVGPACQVNCPQQPQSASSFGQACEIAPAPAFNQGAWRGGAVECPSGVCIRTAASPTLATVPHTSPWCTISCERDADCAGGETAMPGSSTDVRCRKGFTCGVGFEVGDLACRKMCLCRDFLPSGTPVTPASCAR